jgi:hypothetical protein
MLAHASSSTSKALCCRIQFATRPRRPTSHTWPEKGVHNSSPPTVKFGPASCTNADIPGESKLCDGPHSMPTASGGRCAKRRNPKAVHMYYRRIGAPMLGPKKPSFTAPQGRSRGQRRPRKRRGNGCGKQQRPWNRALQLPDWDGLDPGAVTPESIALTIVAEVHV